MGEMMTGSSDRYRLLEPRPLAHDRVLPDNLFTERGIAGRRRWHPLIVGLVGAVVNHFLVKCKEIRRLSDCLYIRQTVGAGRRIDFLARRSGFSTNLSTAAVDIDQIGLKYDCVTIS